MSVVSPSSLEIASGGPSFSPGDTSAPEIDLQFVDEAIQRVGRSPDRVIPLLQELQDHFGYLPEPALRRIAATTAITPAAITGVGTFYDLFRHTPRGKSLVRVCHGTACHVSGAERVEDSLRRLLGIPAGQDTDPDLQFTIESVACLGCCTLAPVMQIDQVTHGHATVEKLPRLLTDHQRSAHASPDPHRTERRSRRGKEGTIYIQVGLGSCCMAKGSDRLFAALHHEVERTGCNVVVKRVGCVGMCHRTPMVEIAMPERRSQFYAGLNAEQVPALLERQLPPRGLGAGLSRWWNQAIDFVLDDAPANGSHPHALDRQAPPVRAFLDRQVHLATEYFGKLDPLDLEEYLAHDGFVALRRCLTQTAPEQIIETIVESGLRGRGGAGFPTGQKWRVVRNQSSETKYVICNGDEGDPGAFMDRMLLESFPYRIIEGLALAAVAVGAHEGIFYIRHEYPLAVRRVRAALAELEQRGWLGEKLLGFDYSLRLSIMEGAGAFICGEETALIASLEGRRGTPRLRPPFPAEAGLGQKPTLINNVETLALVPWILRHGATPFAALGTTSSKGTKVFALAGKVRRGGLIEVPMGTTIREIVEEIGGGAAAGHRFKAVQIGGPSGGCVPARLADTPVDYESLRAVGAIMGSGGLVVLDETDCMVDMARYFLQFTQDQSCGKCTFCRIGTKRMLEILERLCAGQGQRQDLAELESLAHQVSAGSLCGLGKTAPNPVLTTLRYYRDEYEAHLAGRCPAGRCTALIRYVINEACTGCTLCAQNCPVNAIPFTPYAQHVIDSDKCTRCDACRRVCPHGAVEVI